MKWIGSLIAPLIALVFASSVASAQGALPISREDYARAQFWRAGNVKITRPRVDFRAYMPPVGNQGNQGSCAAWAAGYAVRRFLSRHPSRT